MIYLEVAPIPSSSFSIEEALRIGVLAVTKQQLLDPEVYPITAKPITVTIEATDTNVPPALEVHEYVRDKVQPTGDHALDLTAAYMIGWADSVRATKEVKPELQPSMRSKRK